MQIEVGVKKKLLLNEVYWKSDFLMITVYHESFYFFCVCEYFPVLHGGVATRWSKV